MLQISRTETTNGKLQTVRSPLTLHLELTLSNLARPRYGAATAPTQHSRHRIACVNPRRMRTAHRILSSVASHQRGDVRWSRHCKGVRGAGAAAGVVAHVDVAEGNRAAG